MKMQFIKKTSDIVKFVINTCIGTLKCVHAGFCTIDTSVTLNRTKAVVTNPIPVRFDSKLVHVFEF